LFASPTANSKVILELLGYECPPLSAKLLNQPYYGFILLNINISGQKVSRVVAALKYRGLLITKLHLNDVIKISLNSEGQIKSPV
jgi:hypothetical protein